MNNEMGKEAMDIKKELADIKEEIIKLNNLITNLKEDFKINLDEKIREKDSIEIEDILKKSFNNF